MADVVATTRMSIFAPVRMNVNEGIKAGTIQPVEFMEKYARMRHEAGDFPRCKAIAEKQGFMSIPFPPNPKATTNLCGNFCGNHRNCVTENNLKITS